MQIRIMLDTAMCAFRKCPQDSKEDKLIFSPLHIGRGSLLFRVWRTPLSFPEEIETDTREPSLAWALAPVVFLIAVLSYTIIWLEDDPRIPIILGAVAAAIVGWKHGFSWAEMQKGIVKGISVVVPAILILMLIGIMIGLWISGGVVPIMIHTGLQVLSPSGLPAPVLCSRFPLAGELWTTAGSVGIALIGVGDGLGISPAMSAGAIVSGAYFGDKMSPLSDSTNLAPAVVGVELVDHIKHMFFTTGPSFDRACRIRPARHESQWR